MKRGKEAKDGTGSKSVTLGSTSGSGKRGANNIGGIRSYSLPKFGKQSRKETDRRRMSGSEGETSVDKDEDVASPNVMAKSIAGLLTTASMYVGIGDIQQAEKLAQGSGKLKEGDDYGAEAGAAGAAGASAAGSEVASSGEEVRSSEWKDTMEPGSEDESRRSTLFELSIVPQADEQTSQGPKSKGRALRITANVKSKFNLEDEEQLIKEYPCWLLQDVLIQGHIYLTSKNLLFFAFLSKTNGSAKLTGSLSTNYNSISISGKPTRYWTVLKDHTLSLYSSATDLYFPILTIDLRHVTKVQHYKEDGLETKKFVIATDGKTYTFYADNEHSARTWSSALKKQVFATQNSDNDSVTIKIPLCNIIDIEDHAIVEQGLTLRIRVMESAETFALDDYFFMFFNTCGNQLKEIIKDQLDTLERLGSNVMINYCRAPSPSFLNEKSNPEDFEFAKEGSTEPRKSSSKSPSAQLLLSTLPNIYKKETSPKGSSSSLLPRSTSRVKKRFKSVTGGLKLSNIKKPSQSDSSDPTQKSASLEASLAPDEQSSECPSPTEATDPTKARNSWHPKSLYTLRNMWNAQPSHYPVEGYDLFSDDDEMVVEDVSEREAANARFKQHFSLTEDEALIAPYYTYLNRNMPLYGKIYLGKSVICFRSLLPGSKTKMILPLKDVENCFNETGFKFGYFGLVVVIHGHEELFFEFASQKSRDDAEMLILKVIDTLVPLKDDSELDSGNSENALKGLTLQDATNDAKWKLFEDKINSVGYDIPIMVEYSPYYKTTITPKKFYTFGLLTIGSRGDVQPYIALGKGLIEEGHKVIIISHEEFSDWVTSHGLEFRSIAGDPGELMSLMVQHGSMNVGLIREAASNFREWIKDLLVTSWEACQNIDVLIESPSAMAGIHIAEALEIPYFRAFTMPWTKTRAYPHAFIVPDQKRGGNYNYFTHVLFENIFWRGINGQINKWRVETLQLKKTSLEFMQQSKVPFLYNMSPTIFPPSVDFSEWIKVTGYWFLDESKNYEPPKELSQFIQTARNRGKKLVYIGFGSIVVKEPDKMTEAVVSAVTKADVYCILNKGWSDRLKGESRKPSQIVLPDYVFNSGSVPHDWLFPQLDAAVHHGGSGTTGATLRAGIPAIIKPFFGDQFFYANRIEDIGAGIALKKLNKSTLSLALNEVTTNARIIAKAKRIGQDISKEDGVGAAISFIYSEMAYAKSLVKAKRQTEKQLNRSGKPVQPEASWLLL